MHGRWYRGARSKQHHVLANGLIEFPANEMEPRIEPWINKDKWVNARTLYEKASERGLTTAQVD
jgi:hypothetical protein